MALTRQMQFYASFCVCATIREILGALVFFSIKKKLVAQWHKGCFWLISVGIID